MAKPRNCYCNNLFPSSNKLRMVWWKWKVKFKRKRCCLVGEKVKHKKLLSNKLIKIDLRKWFEPRSSISWLRMIIWVTEVMKRTVVGDWRFDNFCGSHLQGHSELDSDDGLRKRLSKLQSPTTVRPSQDSSHPDEQFQSRKLPPQKDCKADSPYDQLKSNSGLISYSSQLYSINVLFSPAKILAETKWRPIAWLPWLSK